MSKQETLEKAIQSAIKNGWKPLIDGKFIEVSNNKFTGELHLAHEVAWNRSKWALGQSVQSAIFDHDFARALWGEEINDEEHRYTSYEIPMWQWHLQQMVVSEDPIKYISEHIE